MATERPAATATFAGFPPGLFAFFEGLRDDNSKTFWTAHKADYEADVRTPMRALLDELGAEFGPMRMFRPHRDTRFTADKAPYQEWAGGTSTDRAAGGVGYYLRVDPDELVTGFGAAVFDRNQLQRFRQLIADDTTGPEFEALGAAQDRAGLPITEGVEPPLKRAPVGFDADHPRIELLRWKGAFIVQRWPRAPWLETPEAFERIHAVWSGAQPLRDWFAARL